MDGDVRMEIRDGVAELVLDRPAKHNAVTPAMARRLLDHTRALDADDGGRAVLLRGEGERAFCAGSDLNALAAYPSAWHFRNRLEYAAAVRNIRKPVVAALQGWTRGAARRPLSRPTCAWRPRPCGWASRRCSEDGWAAAAPLSFCPG
jgi:enoyl-CoA hydratase